MKAARPRVVIVPTLDEAESIVACLEALSALPDCDVMVLDDDSPDGTAAIARAWAGGRPGVHVIVRLDAAARPGLGHALRRAFDDAAALGYRAACVFDADLQHRPSDARRLLDSVESGADVAVGARSTRADGDEEPLGWGSRAASAALRRAFGVPWRDATTDFMALRMACWTPELGASIRAGGLCAAFEVRWRVARAGGVVVELDVPCLPRTAGRAHAGLVRTARWAAEVAALAWERRRTAEAAAVAATGDGASPGVARTDTSDEVPGPARVARLLSSGAPLKLHLACGKRYIPGWVHIDVDDWPHVDLVQTVERLPLPDASAQEIYNCHQIAYYDRVTVIDVLAEWRRVLVPGGRLRIATADFEAIVAEYGRGRPLEAFDGLLHGRYPVRAQSAARLGLGSPTDGRTAVPIYYRTAHDLRTLGAALRQAGFEDVRRYDWRTTEHAAIDDYAQAYLPHMDKTSGRLMSLNIEARRPLA